MSMFGNLGQLAQLLRNAGQIKDGLKDMQARMAAARFTGEAGGGQVRATVDGKGEIQSITIDPELVRAGDTELIEDLVCAGVREAVRLSREGAQKEVEALTGGVNLGSVMDMFGGGKP
ncbi:MAG: YbaB/EbfC family nucleoid-associated protein [Phycisphaerae bacterium]|nr:YbaB/EbfC family nucleoid-associated protein [Phycisphaerae bacterium]NUQ50748.1 YbaB/EbfC family nucleoid-associated protein [Phycisphaerae bacterium]